LNIKERIMAVYHGEEPDRIPLVIYSELCPRGYVERQLRNKGLGLKVAAPVWRVEMPHVHVDTKTVGNLVSRTFYTPVGSVSMKVRIGLREGAGASWIVEYPIKDVSDFEVVEFIAEDTIYLPDYEPFLEAERNLGDDGIVFVWAGRSPLQEMQIELMGYKTFAIALYKYPKEFERLLKTLEKRADERLYEKYIIPFYEKQAQLLHKKGKILEDHMDGKLKYLKDLISKTDIDVVEAFTPPPMGDLTLMEARAAWKEKIISLNFPESVFLEGLDAVKEYTLKLLSEAAPGDNFMIIFTEDIPAEYRWNGLLTVANVLEAHAHYPIRGF